MRELGHRGGKARRKGVAEQLPETERASLRDELRRGLDPELVVRTANEILSGQNQAARGNMIRFLADLELYRQDGGCPRCAEAEAEAEANADKNREAVVKLCVDSIVEVLEGSPKTGLARMAAAVLDERQRARIAELHTLRLDQIRAASADDLTREALAGT